MDKEQIKAISESIPMEQRFSVEQIVSAAIESYKAELLKEVGEPVGYLHQWIEYHPYGDTVAGEPCSAITNDGKPFDKSDTVTLLFTSDQVAAAIESYKAGLLKEVGEPVASQFQDEDGNWYPFINANHERNTRDSMAWPIRDLYTSDQVAAAILKATKRLEDQLAAAHEEIQELRQDLLTSYGESEVLSGQLAKAEQRVAEACALQVATETRFHRLDAARVAKEIRSGEWRKFVKEV